MEKGKQELFAQQRPPQMWCPAPWCLRLGQNICFTKCEYFIHQVKPDGSAHVKKVVFKKPEQVILHCRCRPQSTNSHFCQNFQVDVLGSISDQKKRSDTYLKNSVNKMRPIAAQKILKTARSAFLFFLPLSLEHESNCFGFRYVLKAPSTVERKN